LIYINRGLGIGDWGLGNPQSPIPNPQAITIVNINLLILNIFNIEFIMNNSNDNNIKNLKLNL